MPDLDNDLFIKANLPHIKKPKKIYIKENLIPIQQYDQRSSNIDFKNMKEAAIRLLTEAKLREKRFHFL